MSRLGPVVIGKRGARRQVSDSLPKAERPVERTTPRSVSEGEAAVGAASILSQTVPGAEVQLLRASVTDLGLLPGRGFAEEERELANL